MEPHWKETDVILVALHRMVSKPRLKEAMVILYTFILSGPTLDTHYMYDRNTYRCMVILLFFWLDGHVLAWGTQELTVNFNTQQKRARKFSVENLPKV